MKAVFTQLKPADQLALVERIFNLAGGEWTAADFDIKVRSMLGAMPYSTSFVLYFSNKDRFRDLKRGEDGLKIFEKCISDATNYELESIPEDFNDDIKQFLGFISIQDPDEDLYKAGDALVEKVKELK